MEKKNNKWLVIIIVALVIIIAGLIIFIAFNKNNKENTNNKSNTEQEIHVISENEALTLGNILWEYAYTTHLGNGLAWPYHLENNGNYVCEVTNEQVKQNYTSNFKMCYSSGENEQCITIDEVLSQKEPCTFTSKAADPHYLDTIITVKNIEQNKVTYTATSRYCDHEICNDGDATSKKIEKDFIITKVNNEWKIEYFYLPI